jgi:hypothetical protein
VYAPALARYTFLTMKVGKLLASAEFHKWATISWASVGSAISLTFPDSVAWVVAMSLYANIVGHWSSYQAARAEEATTPKKCPHCGKCP